MRQVGVSKLLLAIVVAVALVFCAAVALSVPTKPESYVTDNMTEAINFSINSSVSLRNVTFNWNGTNYTFYDDSLLCLVNFNQSDTLGDTASKAVDVSRYGNNITLRGTSTWTSNGKYGSGIYFDGATTYGELPLSMVGGLTRFSVAFWIRTAESGTSVNFYQCPHMFGQESTGAPSHDFGIYTYNGFIGFWSGLAPGGDVNYRSTTTKINNGMWHHVVVSNDGSNAYLYVDGAYESSIGTGLSMTQAPFLGGLNSGNSTVIEHKGTYDEFMFWNRPLSASEITMLYRTNLYKYASDKWVLYINQSVSVPYGRAGYSYSATVLDGDDVTNTTEIRNITFQPLSQAGLFSSSIRNNGLTTASAVPINASINSSDLYNLTLDWNGTAHTLYDGSLVLALDFDNVAAIGDSSTNVTDLSRYNHSVTMA
ncbi:MAG: LamG domain-containing protein, partial [Candidatus Bilamarchaeaceae archaeon]